MSNIQENSIADPGIVNSEAPSLLDYLLVLVKHKVMISLTTFVAVVLTAIFSLNMPNIYTAKAMIIPGDDDKGGIGALMSQLGGLATMAGGAGSKSTSDLYITMLKSETLKDPIVDRFKLMETYKQKFRTDVYKTLDSLVGISLGKKDGVITIQIEEKDPKLAANLANAYVEELGKLITRLNMTGAGNNRLFLEKRLEEARSDLSKSEDTLKAFQLKNKIISVPDQAQATIGGIAQLKGQLAIQEVQLGALQGQFTDTSQEVKTAKATIANLRKQIAGLEGKGVGSSSILAVGVVPQLGQEYLRLMREFKIQEAIFEMLTKQYEMSQFNETKDVLPFQVLQKAKVPERKSGPLRIKIIAKVFLVSLLGSCVLVLLLNKLKNMPETEKVRWKSLFQYKLIAEE